MSLTLLVIGDVHYGADDPASSPEGVMGELACEWIQRVCAEGARLAKLDAVLLTGDLLNDGTMPDSQRRLDDLNAVLAKTELPIIVSPGNHDLSPEVTLAALGATCGAHRLGEYIVYTFRDVFREDDTWVRPPEEMDRFLKETKGAPVITLQHGPIYPEIPGDTYPHIAANAGEIVDSYDRANVLLSLSGHFHNGQPLAKRHGTGYMTCPAFFRAPFVFHIVTVDGGEVSIARHELAMPEGSRLWDGHTHSHFGYCAVDVHPKLSLQRADQLGLAGLSCVEHAGQVYLTFKEFWKAEHVNKPGILRRAREEGRDRMAEFRRDLETYRSPRLRFGLETEIDQDGKLSLLEEDAEGWDVILGAVHWLPSRFPTRTADERERAFLWCVEKMVEAGIQVLAHPFRIFQNTSRPRPRELYPIVARMLAQSGVAAEVNCHVLGPDPEFFRICAAEGVRIVLGSDAHSLFEVGELHTHLRFLQSIGLTADDVSV